MSKHTPVIPDLIAELLKHDIPVRLDARISGRGINGRVDFMVDGFGKSGEVRLVHDGDSEIADRPRFKAYSRYNRVDDIEDAKDLVLLNMYWAEVTAGRNGDTAEDFQKYMPAEWKNLAVSCGVAEKKTSEVTSFSFG